MIGDVVHVMRIATGEIEESGSPNDGKDPVAKSLGARVVRLGESHVARAPG